MKLYSCLSLPFWAVIKLFQLSSLAANPISPKKRIKAPHPAVSAVQGLCLGSKVSKGVSQVNFLREIQCLTRREYSIMGIPPVPLLSFDSKGIHGNEEISDSNGSLWSKLLEAQAKRRMKVRNQRITNTTKARHVRCRRPRSILMKRRARREGFRRHTNPIEKKVKTLKKLIPNNESIGLDGLFSETAEYILSLQTRVKVMQIMVNVLTGSNY